MLQCLAVEVRKGVGGWPGPSHTSSARGVVRREVRTLRFLAVHLLELMILSDRRDRGAPVDRGEPPLDVRERRQGIVWLAFLGRWSKISPGRREAARVAHEELDQPTSSRRPAPESDMWCSSR